MGTETVIEIQETATPRRERGTGRLWQIGEVWYIRYYAHGRPIRESSHSKKKMVAEALLARRLVEKAEGMLRSTNPDKLRYTAMRDALYAKYRNQERHSLHRAKDGREYVIGVSHLDDSFTGYCASGITTKAMREFVEKRLAAGASRGSINGCLALLRSMFGTAFKDGLLRRDDVPYFPMFPQSQPRDVRLSPSDFEALHRELPDHLKAPVRLAYFTGLRRAEVFGLKWENVDWQAGVIRLSGKVTKTGEPRMAPLLGPVLTELRVLFLNRTQGAELVFQKDGKPIVEFRRSWRSALRRAGLPSNFVFHGLRYCAASNLTSAGVPQALAMRVTGHKTAAMFKRYNLGAESDIAEAGRKVQAYTEAQLGASSGQMDVEAVNTTSATPALRN